MPTLQNDINLQKKRENILFIDDRKGLKFLLVSNFISNLISCSVRKYETILYSYRLGYTFASARSANPTRNCATSPP